MANENSGVLFRNKDKDEDHPNWPDYQGKATVDEGTYFISGWIKTAKTGDKFMSLAFKPAEQKKEAPQKKSAFDDMDDDIPF